MARVTHLDTIDTFSNKRLDSLARRRMRGMREDRESAGAMNQPDGIGDRQTFFADVRRLSIAEVSLERVAEIDGPALGDHGARDVWSPDGRARRLLEHRRKLDANAELVEPMYDALRPRPPHLTQA